MTTIHVCSRGDVAKTVNSTGAQSLVSISGPGDPVPSLTQIDRHLKLTFQDVGGNMPPTKSDIEKLLSFASEWDRAKPIVVHCWQGVSRSPAAAFIVACSLFRSVAEAHIARMIRKASPTAQPNIVMVSIADEVMGRGGRMVEAIASAMGAPKAGHAKPFGIGLPGRDG